MARNTCLNVGNSFARATDETARNFFFELLYFSVYLAPRGAPHLLPKALAFCADALEERRVPIVILPMLWLFLLPPPLAPPASLRLEQRHAEAAAARRPRAMRALDRTAAPIGPSPFGRPHRRLAPRGRCERGNRLAQEGRHPLPLPLPLQLLRGRGGTGR